VSPQHVGSERPPPADPRPKNKLLACLPREDFQRLQPHLTTVSMAVKQVIHRRNEPIRQVYFPNGGVASVTAVMTDGAMVEIATIGDEGLLGMNAFFGDDDMMVGEAMLQVPDTSAEMLSIERFREELNRREALYDCVRRYSQGLLTLMTQSTACMALHQVQPRCCRWLLMAHDRIRQDQFELSHEFLAMMLGSTRPTVTAVAGSLQKAGLIRYVHGRITIVDRKGLEAVSCECYATVKEHFDRLGL
jgi:CRP-like cAMP-binding protein